VNPPFFLKKTPFASFLFHADTQEFFLKNCTFVAEYTGSHSFSAPVIAVPAGYIGPFSFPFVKVLANV